MSQIKLKMRKHKILTTGFLFGTPSFLSGFGTAINLAGNFYEFNFSETGFEADEMAIANDFKMVGQDFFSVIEGNNKDYRNLISTK